LERNRERPVDALPLKNRWGKSLNANWAVTGLVVCYCASLINAQNADGKSESPTQIPFKPLRYDEDYSSLRDNSSTNLLGRLKFIPLNAQGDSWITLGGEIRERYEYYQNPLWGSGSQDEDGYLLQRYLFHIDSHIIDRLRIFTQFQSNLEVDRRGGPRSADLDEFDLHQAFFDLGILPSAETSMDLRVGEQEMNYGSLRLVSARDSPNARLSFVGAKTILRVDEWQLDSFAVKPVRNRRGLFDDDPDPNQSFWGLYSVVPTNWPIKGGKLDLYYFGLEKSEATFNQGKAREARQSLGARWSGKTVGYDYNFEVVYQFGSFGRGEIRAWTAASDVGFTFVDLAARPRLALKANITSGDEDPNKPNLETFNPLFPRGSYFGEPALIGPANHMDIHPQADVSITKDLVLTVDWDCFWRESSRDGIYGPGMNVLRTGSSSNASFVGHQAEVSFEWPIERHLTVNGDYAHFFAGGFLRQSTSGTDMDYVSFWITYRF
jgi:hypothetical protein